MNYVKELLANQVLIAALSGWMVAQIAKTIIYFIVNKSFRAERMIGDGGMPSCHSATVCGLATAVAFTEGLSSTMFGVAAFFAIIVMHDAMGVRLETGKQAKVINDILQEFRERGMAIKFMSPEERLKEFVGHTGIQVFVGAIIGIIVATVEWLLIYR